MLSRVGLAAVAAYLCYRESRRRGASASLAKATPVEMQVSATGDAPGLGPLSMVEYMGLRNLRCADYPLPTASAAAMPPAVKKSGGLPNRAWCCSTSQSFTSLSGSS